MQGSAAEFGRTTDAMKKVDSGLFDAAQSEEGAPGGPKKNKISNNPADLFTGRTKVQGKTWEAKKDWKPRKT